MEPDINDIKKDVDKLFDFHDEKIEKLHQMETRQVEIQGDIKHIKSRIDNGMSATIAKMNENLTKLFPVISHHSDIVKRIENIGWTLATSLLLALCAYLAWGFANGFKPHV